MREEQLYKRGNKYYFDITIDGKRIRKSTGTNSFREAVEVKENFLRLIRNKLATTITKNYSSIFDDVVIRFLENKKRTIRDKTFILYKLLLKNLFKYFNNKDLNNIRKIDLNEYINYRKLQNASDGFIRKELSLLQNIYNFAIENELVNNNPFMSFKFKKELKDYNIRDRILTLEEIDKLLNNSSEDLKRLIIFLLETCMRINEALKIQFTDIATDQRTNIQYIRVRKEITKNKKERYIPLSKEALEQILKNKVDKPNSIYIFTTSKGDVYKTTPKRTLNTAIKKANLKQFGFHIFRHTGASYKLQGINYKGEKIKPKRIEIISELLGHSDINLTRKIYAKFDKQSFFAEMLE